MDGRAPLLWAAAAPMVDEGPALEKGVGACALREELGRGMEEGEEEAEKAGEEGRLLLQTEEEVSPPQTLPALLRRSLSVNEIIQIDKQKMNTESNHSSLDYHHLTCDHSTTLFIWNKSWIPCATQMKGLPTGSLYKLREFMQSQQTPSSKYNEISIWRHNN